MKISVKPREHRIQAQVGHLLAPREQSLHFSPSDNLSFKSVALLPLGFQHLVIIRLTIIKNTPRETVCITYKCLVSQSWFYMET